ncbi:MAG TPA: M14 family metallopeptidase [Bacteroidales bacterium]|jgi:dipeptidyl-peptidase-4|nr:M14 family metallopeptidase [Bacteroidales bacterium]
MKRILIIIGAIFLSLSPAFSQLDLLTKAESSDFKSTSDYNDVMSFISGLKKSSSYIRTETIAVSVEGREIPLLVIGNPLPKSPEDLRNDKRTVVYIQCNIHAGEVEGKEAGLMYARDILKDKNSAVLKNSVILICPFINPDGNEKISPLNRTHQNGPMNGVGVRYNGQFLDLNRDGMKAESPELRGLLKNVFNKWDPSVFMDCHTTNGSYHVEPVTFTWAVNPNGDNSLIKYMRDKMMPAMHQTLFEKYKVENCFYGEFVDMLEPEKGWILDASEPRYITNYYGLRNRLGILNENYVYSDYKARVLGCYYLIHSLMDYVSGHGQEIKQLLKETDEKTVSRGLNPSPADSFAIEYDVRPAPEKVLVKTYEAELVSQSEGYPNYRKTDRRKDVTVPYLIDYYPRKSIAFPFAYLLTVPDPDILELLKAHGIHVEKLATDSKITAESFIVTGLKPAARLNQGHYTNTITGRHEMVSVNFPAGTLVIRTAQPLANVAAYLLEPESNDGLVFWNFFDRYLVPQWGSGFNDFPVYRVLGKTDLRTESYTR